MSNIDDNIVSDIGESGIQAEEVAPAPAGGYQGTVDIQTEVLVLGAGPGGYTAAFRASDLGKKTLLVERYETLGGVCLNVGCIPSKALLHAAKIIEDVRRFASHGIKFAEPTIDLDVLRGWKDGVVKRITDGLKSLAKQRKVRIVTGVGSFLDPHHLEVIGKKGGSTVIKFERAIIAAGSQSVKLPNIPDDPRVLDSTKALQLQSIPESMLVLGGGIIGLELATIYHALGTRITVVEMNNGLIRVADKDIVRPLHKQLAKRYEQILLKTKVVHIEPVDEGLLVSFEGNKAPESQLFNSLLVSVGRTPNGNRIGAEKAGVDVDARGFISIDNQMRTNVPHIFAIGDIVGQPMLAHKANHEGKIAAEVCADMNSYFDDRVIPAVAFTDPEVAWVGVTETEARAKKLNYGKGIFPWKASGRSLALGQEDGLTKILFDNDNKKVIGMSIVGPNAGDLISEGALAIEMGAKASDIGLTIHPHPTLSETLAMAAEVFEGTVTDLFIPKKKQPAS